MNYPHFDDLPTKTYKKLKEMILNGELTPGQKLIQEDLAARLGVSRTPLLQAISRLQSDNLVTTVPRRGAYVKAFSGTDIWHAYEIRAALEPLAVSEIGKIDFAAIESCLKKLSGLSDAEYFHHEYEFHELLLSFSDNKLISNMLRANRILYNTEKTLLAREQSETEHRQIVETLKRKDRASASALLAIHLRTGSKDTIKQLILEDNNG